MGRKTLTSEAHRSVGETNTHGELECLCRSSRKPCVTGEHRRDTNPGGIEVVSGKGSRGYGWFQNQAGDGRGKKFQVRHTHNTAGVGTLHGLGYLEEETEPSTEAKVAR